MAEAEPVIRAALPDANVPISIRQTGIPVDARGRRPAATRSSTTWLAGQPRRGRAASSAAPFQATRRESESLTPELAKGLEFDLVVIVDPESFGGGIEGAVDRYVAMTRTTRQLAVLSDG